jgi:hypothetical protein
MAPARVQGGTNWCGGDRQWLRGYPQRSAPRVGPKDRLRGGRAGSLWHKPSARRLLRSRPAFTRGIDRATSMVEADVILVEVALRRRLGVHQDEESHYALGTFEIGGRCRNSRHGAV